ncbi:MAG: hypothetical protein IKG85_01470, partial [Clostridia bacterium]|nr:hypothetical protein [Clostridia bacterium]
RLFLSPSPSAITVSTISMITRTNTRLTRKKSPSWVTMVNVTDGADVNVGLGSFEFLLCHFGDSS